MPERGLAPGELAAIDLTAGNRMRVTAAADGQDAEMVVHDAADPRHRLSTLVTGLAEEAYTLRPGLRLWTERYQPLLRVESLSSEEHDIVLEACTPWLNEALGHRCGGRSCWEGFREWLDGRGLPEKWVPYPVGIFRRTGELDGRYRMLASESRVGDYVEFSAEAPCVALVTSCAIGQPADGKERIKVSWNES